MSASASYEGVRFQLFTPLFNTGEYSTMFLCNPFPRNANDKILVSAA